MGQRLVVNICSSDIEEPILSLYYHWSAYPSSSVYQVTKILDVLMNSDECNLDNINSIRKNILKFCESEGGGIDGGKDGDEWKRIKNLYPNITPKEDGIDRSNGIIAFSSKGISEQNSWSEGTVDIYLDTEEVSNGVIWEVDYEWENELLDDDDNEFEIKDDEYIEINFSPSECTWDELIELYGILENNDINYIKYDEAFYDFRE